MELTFKHWQVAEDTYAIQCPGYLPGPGRLPGWGYVICYLLIGRDRALLQDTGYGNADLKGYVAALTERPLTVVNSHIHPDHSGGNQQFGEIIVLEEETASEKPVYFPMAGEKARCELVQACGDYCFKRAPDGTVIDLGGREIELRLLEGHTRGSMVLLDRTNQLLFSGDAVLKRVLLLSGLPLSRYRAALARMKERGGYTEIHSAHWYEPLGADYIDKMLALIDSYDPAKTEDAPWGDMDKLVMYCHGNAFEEKEFCAIGFSSKNRELMLQ